MQDSNLDFSQFDDLKTPDKQLIALKAIIDPQIPKERYFFIRLYQIKQYLAKTFLDQKQMEYLKGLQTSLQPVTQKGPKPQMKQQIRLNQI